MEIEGFTFLTDLKISIKKRLYRHVITQVEKKFEKDYQSLSTDHLVQIFFKQIEAVHGLIDEVVSGRFDRGTEKTQKLIKIMNRNIIACSNIFESNMSRELMQTRSSTHNLKKPQKPLTRMLQNFTQFIGLVMDSCFYVYMLRLISGVNAPEFQSFTHQCRFILKHLISSSQNDYKTQLSIGRIYLLLMGINIKNSNYTQAKQEFYQAITNILASLRVIFHKRKDKKKIYERQKRDMMLLIFVGLINYQRMLIESENFVGWDIGFSIMRDLEKWMKTEQSSWRKYIRIEYQTRQILYSKKLDEISQIYVPFFYQHSNCLKSLMEESKIKRFTGIELVNALQIAYPIRKRTQPKRTFYSTTKKLSNQTIDQQKQASSYIITYNQSKSKRFVQAIQNNSQGKENQRKQLKKSKFPSIDWFSQSQSNSEILNAIFSNTAESKVSQIKKSAEFEKKQRPKQTVKTDKKLKKSILFPQSPETQQFFQFHKEKTKLKRKKCAIFRLISDQNDSKDDFSVKYENNKYKNGKLIKYKQENDKENKSIEIGYTENFIKLLVENKMRIHICSLVDRYEIAKKRKKARNYHVEILQFQLQKSIGNFVTPATQTVRKSTTLSNFSFRHRNSILNFGLLANVGQANQQREEEKQSKQKLIEAAYSKSQEGIKQMLKKITANQHKYRTKRSPKKSTNYSELYLSYRPIQ